MSIDKLIKAERLQSKDCTDILLKNRHAYNAAQRVLCHSHNRFYLKAKPTNTNFVRDQKKKLATPITQEVLPAIKQIEFYTSRLITSISIHYNDCVYDSWQPA